MSSPAARTAEELIVRLKASWQWRRACNFTRSSESQNDDSQLRSTGALHRWSLITSRHSPVQMSYYPVIAPPLLLNDFLLAQETFFHIKWRFSRVNGGNKFGRDQVCRQTTERSRHAIKIPVKTFIHLSNRPLGQKDHYFFA